jgi:hypothetical protein
MSSTTRFLNFIAATKGLTASMNKRRTIPEASTPANAAAVSLASKLALYKNKRYQYLNRGKHSSNQTKHS